MFYELKLKCLNQEYQIVDVPDVNSYVIQARTAGTSIQSITVDGQLVPTLVTADALDTGNGGASVVGAYQINTGLAVAVGGRKLIWTPGVNLAVGDGEMGQRYGDPRKAVLGGSDGIIVGSGIHGANDPRGAAAEYAKVSWNAKIERLQDFNKL